MKFFQFWSAGKQILRPGSGRGQFKPNSKIHRIGTICRHYIDDVGEDCRSLYMFEEIVSKDCQHSQDGRLLLRGFLRRSHACYCFNLEWSLPIEKFAQEEVFDKE